jgi:chromosomal replication initiator protein
MAPNTLWSQLQKKLQQQLAPEEYETWFRPLRARSDGDGRLVLLAPNERFLSTLEESYRPALDRALAGLNPLGREILFVLDEGDPGASAPASLAAASSSTAPLAPSLAFNPKYLFENFVVGNSNQFAHAAARAVADRPSSNYNPLFLYGGVGLGKTHLLHAVGHQILSLHPHLRVLYLPAEQFVNELINSIRFDRMPAFRERYRTIDALLIDDVQFIANKERTQEEFFHTFNTLYTSQKQIILSSDSSPKDIPTLEERLRSRFQWGLIADIQPPDLETKVAILRKKADFEGADLPNEVAEFVAQQVKSNIRELEGMLNRVIAFSSLTGKPLSLELARETLRDILPHEGRKPTAAEITKSVARHYGLKVVEIKSKNNSKQISFPRQVAMYLCKRLTDLSYPEIGKQFNDKHHSTVMYSVDKIQQLRQDDSDFDRVLQNLERGLS